MLIGTKHNRPEARGLLASRPGFVAIAVAVAFAFAGFAGVAGEEVVKVGPDSEVAARDLRIHDLLGKGNLPVRLDDHIQPTEQLEYTAYVGVLPAGSIQFTLNPGLRSRRQGGGTMRARLNVQPNDGLGVINKLLSKILDYSTEAISTMDAETGRSLLFTRDEIVQDRLMLRERLQLDYGEKDERGRPAPVARFSEDKRTKKNSMKNLVRDPYPIPPSVQDSLSAFYYARSLPLNKPGDRQHILLATKKRLDVVNIDVVAEEKINLGPLGRYDCLVIEPHSENDAEELVRTRGRARMWIEKNTRIVMKIQLDLHLGGVETVKIVAPLTSVKNNPQLLQHRLVP